MKSASIKAAGRRFANEVVEVLRANGHPSAERRVTYGANDQGDILGVVGWVLEAKAEKRLDPAGALSEAKDEAGHAGVPWYAAVLRRRGRPATEAYVVMPLWLFARYTSGEPAEPPEVRR